MKKLARFSLWTLLAIVCLVVVVAVYLRNADLSIYESQIESYLSEKIGHRLDIDGTFSLQVKSKASLTAENVLLSNPAWSADSKLVSVGHISVTVDLWSLFSGPVIIEQLNVRDVNARVERSVDGQSNWSTGRPVSTETPSRVIDFIAFRDVDVENVQFAYIDAARRKPITATLERVSVSPNASNILDLDVHGTINEFPLWADGKLGPWQNLLDGKDLLADLDLTLGQVHLAIDGSVADALALEGVEAAFKLNGPAIDHVADRLGFPPFATGPFELKGNLKKLGGGNVVEIAGNLGAIKIIANGNVDKLRDPSKTKLDFNIAGPDTQYLAELLGIKGVANVPFLATGDLQQQGSRLLFTATHVKLGENTVALDGWVESRNKLPDIDITIEAAGPDFSIFGPFVKIENLPAVAFDVDGRIEKTKNNWRFSDVVAMVGENRIAANGSIADGKDTEISFSATGPDISFLQSMLGTSGLPDKPFDLSGRIKPAHNAVRIEDVKAVIGDNQIQVDGVVATSRGLAGTRLEVHGQGLALQHIAPLTGVQGLPVGPFKFSAVVEPSSDKIIVTDAVASVGEIQGTATVNVGLGQNAGSFVVDAKATGPNISDLAKIDIVRPFGGDPFSLDARIIRKPGNDELEFEDAKLTIGAISLDADGKISMEARSNDSDLRFSLTGPDMQMFGHALGVDIFAASAFQISGALSGTPSGFAMQNFVAKIGDNDVNGVFEVNLEDKPRLTGTLSSTFLDLTERIAEVVAKESETEPAEDDGLLFSSEPLDGEQLQSADIEIDLKIDSLRTHALDVSDFHIGLNLLDGKLELDPISFREEQGSVNGFLRITPLNGTYTLQMSLQVQDIHIGLTATQDQDRSTLPPLNGKLTLQGEGQSLHELMASSTGALSMRQGKGQILDFGADRIFGGMFLNILRTLNPLHEKQKYRELDCGFYDVNVVDGVATIEEVVIQTKSMTVLVVGNVEFGDEKIDLAVRAKPREGLGISLGGIANSFLKLGGTLKKPVLQIDPKGSAVSGGVAVATGGLSLLAKGFYDRLSAEADICAQDEADSED